MLEEPKEALQFTVCLHMQLYDVLRICIQTKGCNFESLL